MPWRYCQLFYNPVWNLLAGPEALKRLFHQRMIELSTLLWLVGNIGSLIMLIVDVGESKNIQLSEGETGIMWGGIKIFPWALNQSYFHFVAIIFLITGILISDCIAHLDIILSLLRNIPKYLSCKYS